MLPIDQNYKSLEKILTSKVFNRVDFISSQLFSAESKLDQYHKSKVDFNKSKDNYDACVRQIHTTRDRHQAWIFDLQKGIQRNSGRLGQLEQKHQEYSSISDRIREEYNELKLKTITAFNQNEAFRKQIEQRALDFHKTVMDVEKQSKIVVEESKGAKNECLLAIQDLKNEVADLKATQISHLEDKAQFVQIISERTKEML